MYMVSYEFLYVVLIPKYSLVGSQEKVGSSEWSVGMPTGRVEQLHVRQQKVMDRNSYMYPYLWVEIHIHTHTHRVSGGYRIPIKFNN
jgi:hypothetical protein